MKLTTNTFIDGAWYGPDYGDEDLPPEVEAKLGQPATPSSMTMASLMRARLIGAFTAVLDREMVPAFAAMDQERQADLLDRYTDDQLVDALLEGVSLSPSSADAAVLADDDTIVVAPGRHISRGDLVAILDLLEETGAMDDPAATVETAQVLADPDTTAAIAEAEAELVVPEGSVDELLAWVHGADPGEPPADGWRDRATAALGAEKAGGHERKTLVEPLERALAAPDADEDEDEDEVT